MHLFQDQISSPVGVLHLIHDGQALCVLDFDGDEPRLRRLLDQHFRAFDLTSGGAPAAVRQALDAYFGGDLAAVDTVAVRTGGTEFQRRVWAALRQIPASRTISYGALAARIGKPLAARAVGLATGSNPIGIVVPCHRVIGANGSLTGYGGGMARKRWLLAHERRVMEPSLFENSLA